MIVFFLLSYFFLATQMCVLSVTQGRICLPGDSRVDYHTSVLLEGA